MTVNAFLAENLRIALLSCVCVAGLVALAALLGRLALAAAPITPCSRLERCLIEAGVGLGLLAYLPFLLSIGHGLTPAHVRLALVVIIIVVVAGLRVLGGRRLCVSAVQPGEDELAPAWARTTLAVGAVFLAAALVLCLTPMVDYDGLAYHVFAPQRWLQVGSLRMLPTLLYTEWPMGQEMLFTLLLPLVGSGACKPLVALAAALAACAVYALGARLASRPAGMVAATLFLLVTGVPSINTTSVEVLLAFFTTLSALALAACAQAEAPAERRCWLLLGALFAGFACCVKLTGLLALVFVCAWALAIRVRQGAKPMACARDAVLVLAVALTCASPWYVRAWLDTGNPVYPFAYSLFGGRDWSPRAARTLAASYHLFGLPGDTVAARQAALVRQLAKFAAVTTVALAVPGPRWTRGLLLTAGAFALAQILSTDVLRFLLPATALAAVVAGYWAARLGTRLPAAGWAVAALTALALLPVVRDAASALPVVVGSASRTESMRRAVIPMDACLWANRHLPQDARVLFGLDTRAYFLDRDVFWSSPIIQHRIVFDTPAAFRASLRREGITHLLINRNLYHNPQFHFEEQVGLRGRERDYLEDLAAHSRLLWSDANVAVYELPHSDLGP